MPYRNLGAVALSVTVLLLGTAAAVVAAPAHHHAATTARASTNSALAGSVDFDPFGPSHYPLYNSANGTVSVIPTGTVGQYQVTFFKLGFSGGDAQVTAQIGACNVQNWAKTSAGDLTVNIDCFGGTGFPAAQAFDLTVTKPTRAPNGVLDYALVQGTGSGSLTGPYQYNSSRRKNFVTHLGKGRYLVTMPGPGTTGASAGTVKVSTYGAIPGECQVAKWQTTRVGQLVYVDCFTLSGSPSDHDFTAVYARDNNIMGQDGLTDANAFANGTGALYQPRTQYDSARHARVTIVHLDRGLYLFIPAGSPLTGRLNGGLGDFQLTGFGASFANCGFTIRRTHTPLIQVQCLDKNGNQVDAAFTGQWVVR